MGLWSNESENKSVYHEADNWYCPMKWGQNLLSHRTPSLSESVAVAAIIVVTFVFDVADHVLRSRSVVLQSFESWRSGAESVLAFAASSLAITLHHSYFSLQQFERLACSWSKRLPRSCRQLPLRSIASRVCAFAVPVYPGTDEYLANSCTETFDKGKKAEGRMSLSGLLWCVCACVLVFGLLLVFRCSLQMGWGSMW